LSFSAAAFAGYNLDNAQAFHRGLRAGRVDFAVYVPDSILDPVEALLEADPAVQTVVCAREDEGIAIAMGAALGGKTPVALMEGSGLGLSGLVLARGMVQRTPVLLLVGHASGLGGQFDYHAATRMVGQATLGGLGIPHLTVLDAALIETLVREALVTLRGQRIPVGLFVPRHIARLG
jgi:sulfopyruvate decarboxylase TPP-binding subunit